MQYSTPKRSSDKDDVAHKVSLCVCLKKRVGLKQWSVTLIDQSINDTATLLALLCLMLVWAQSCVSHWVTAAVGASKQACKQTP